MGRHTGPSTLQRWWMWARGWRAVVGRRGWRALIPVGLGLAAAGAYAVVGLLGHGGTRSVPSRPATARPTATATSSHASVSTSANASFAARRSAAPTPLPAVGTRQGSQGTDAVSPSATPAAVHPSGRSATGAGGGRGTGASTASRATTRVNTAATTAASQENAGAAAGGTSPATSTRGSASAAAAVTGRTAAAPPPVLIPPVVGRVLSGFGWQYSKVFGDWQEHTGVDLAARVGQTAVAPGAGQVLAVHHDSLWGWVVSIGLDRGYSTNVSGLASVQVRVGQAVQPGTPLGAVGEAPPAEAGLAPHVFWQVFAGSRALDPELATARAAG